MMIYTTRDGTIFDLTTPKGLRALNVAVLEYQGWTEITTDWSKHIDEIDDGYGEWGCSPYLAEWHNMPAPHYTTSLNDALDLFTDLPNDLTPRLVRLLSPRGDHMARTWKGAILNNSDMSEIQAESDSPALAICLAWLAYKDADGTP